MLFNLLISCKQSTALSSKKNITHLSFKEKIALNIHLLICRMCKLFDLQIELILKSISKMPTHNRCSFSEEKKQKMKEMLNDELPL